MITKTESYTTSDDKLWPTLQQARRHEFVEFLKSKLPQVPNTAGELELLADTVLEEPDKVISLLTTKAGPPKRKYTRKKKAVGQQAGALANDGD